MSAELDPRMMAGIMRRARTLDGLHHAYRAYDPAWKTLFKSNGMKFLAEVAELVLDLSSTAYDLRWNAGGVAVSGEVTLHTETIYVQLSRSMVNLPLCLYRTCSGRTDYCGGTNYHCDAVRLPRAVETLRSRTRVTARLSPVI